MERVIRDTPGPGRRHRLAVRRPGRSYPTACRSRGTTAQVRSPRRASWGEYRHPFDSAPRPHTVADITHREWSGRDFDRIFRLAQVGPRRLPGANSGFGQSGSARRRRSACSPESRTPGIRVEISHGYARRLTGQGRIHRLAREYGRDGPRPGGAGSSTIHTGGPDSAGCPTR